MNHPARPTLTRPTRRVRMLAVVAVGIPVVATVATYGELSPQAFVVVLAAGLVLSAVGLVRRAGSGSPEVGAAGLPWLIWLIALAVWELVTRLQNSRMPTLSDLADPLLAHPVARAAATGIWLAAGDWLLRRPNTPRRSS